MEHSIKLEIFTGGASEQRAGGLPAKGHFNGRIKSHYIAITSHNMCFVKLISRQREFFKILVFFR